MTKTLKPFAVADGEGRAYEWHDVVFTMKAAAAETGGALALWDITTKPGEEPHVHVHDDVHEMFYVLAGSITFKVGRTSVRAKKGAFRSMRVEKGGFAFVPRGTPHTYEIHSAHARMLGISTPSDFGDNIERTGEQTKTVGERRRATMRDQIAGIARVADKFDLSLDGREIRAVQHSLNETLHGPADTNLGDDFAKIIQLERREAEDLCLALRDIINEGRPLQSRSNYSFSPRTLRGLVAALNACVERMSKGDFYTRMDLAHADVIELRDRIGAVSK